MQLMAWRMKWLPHHEDTPEAWGIALHLEQEYWANMGDAVANGISKAFSGS